MIETPRTVAAHPRVVFISIIGGRMVCIANTDMDLDSSYSVVVQFSFNARHI